jgi:hypothetical protein
MNGSTLTLGLMGALAAAGALSRRGSRNARPNLGVMVNPDGTPRLLYHQTKPEAQQAIRRQGFRTDKLSNRSSDREMPDGVFLKFNDAALGVGGTQIPVTARVENPLRVRDRAELVRWLSTNSLDYDAVRVEAERSDGDYNQSFDRAFKQKSPGLHRGTPESKVWYQEKSARIDAILAAWSPSSDAYSARLRAIVTQALLDAGHDSLWMERDEGTRGRAVETLVVLDPKRVKPS